MHTVLEEWGKGITLRLTGNLKTDPGLEVEIGLMLRSTRRG